MTEIEAAVTEDLGGPGELSEVQLLLVHDLAFAATLRDLLAAHMASVGPLTAAGKRRAALAAWHRASARVESLARRIGLSRRSRHVDPMEAVRRAVEEANQ